MWSFFQPTEEAGRSEGASQKQETPSNKAALRHLNAEK